MTNSQTRPTRRRWLQFGLRGLLVVFLTLGVSLGLLVRWHASALRQKRSVVALRAGHTFNSIEYKDFEPEFDTLPVPLWLQRFVDVDHLCNVKSVELWHATDDMLRLLPEFPQLEELMISSDSGCTQSGFQELASLKQLNELWLESRLVGDNGVMAIVGSLEKLEFLTIDCGANVTDAGIAELEKLSNLRRLHLNCGFQISDDGLSHLGALRNLEYLDLDIDEDVDHRVTISPGPAGPILQVFVVDLPAGVRGWPWVGNLHGLHQLEINGRALRSNLANARLGELKNLDWLTIRFRDGLNDDVLAEIATLTKLEDLTLLFGKSTETNKGWEQLRAIKNLESLDITLGANVDDAGLASLGECLQLHQLCIRMNDRVQGHGLSSLRKLKRLDLDYQTRSADAPHYQVVIPQSVEHLVINGVQGFSDDDVASLVQLPKLISLGFYWCEKLTDHGLEHLKKMSNLQELGVHRCVHVTGSQISALRAALPNCKVEAGQGGYVHLDPQFLPIRDR
ncbi:MAG TPA: hypothetical protein VGN12_20830 [Pirellulales bacterium]|jgi:Leucine-rich repeat (LRR) protein